MISKFETGPRMSQAVVHGNTVYIAGQVADDRKASLKNQTQQVLAKTDVLLKTASTDRFQLLAVNVFLPHITDFDAMNEVYDAWVDKKSAPVRACIEARLADPDLRIEITAIAALRG